MNSRLVYGAALLLLALIGIGAQSYHWSQIADDSFIFYRYAQNFANGEGLRWNPGETAVEGFSSPLWVMILGLASTLGAPLLTASKILGVTSFGLLVAGVGATTHRLAGHHPTTLASMLATLLCDPLNYWAPSGMETSTYVALLAWVAYALVARRFWLATALLGITSLARPEAPGLVVVVLALLPWTVGRDLPRKRLLMITALALLPLAIYLGFRLAYFGELLPNTYYAKVGGDTWTRLANGLLYIAPAALVWAGALLALVLGVGRRRADQAAPGPLLLVFALATAALLPPLWSGGDWMWHKRFLCPSTPFLIIFVAAATAHLYRVHGAVARPHPLRWWLLALPAAIASAGFYLVGLVSPAVIVAGLTGEHLPVAEIQEGEMTTVSREVAEFLRSRRRPGDWVAVNHAGALPYYSRMPCLDMTGLNDHYIAHQAEGGLHGKFDPGYVLSTRPRFLVLNANVEPNSTQRLPSGKPVRMFYYPGYWIGETALVQHPRFRQEYRFVRRFWTWDWVRPRYILIAERIE